MINLIGILVIIYWVYRTIKCPEGEANKRRRERLEYLEQVRKHSEEFQSELDAQYKENNERLKNKRNDQLRALILANYTYKDKEEIMSIITSHTEEENKDEIKLVIEECFESLDKSDVKL